MLRSNEQPEAEMAFGLVSAGDGDAAALSGIRMSTKEFKTSAWKKLGDRVFGLAARSFAILTLILLAGIILALTYLGSEAAQITLGISDKLGRVFQGLVLFYVLSCDTLIHYRVRLFGANATNTA